jgi:hypothetical protein
VTSKPLLAFRAEGARELVAPCAPRLEREVQVDGLVVRALLLGQGAPLQDSPPAQVNLEQGDADGFIVEEPVTGVFGRGSSPGAAFEDFVHALLEYRLVLLRESPGISERLAGHLRFIEGLIGR